MPLTLTLPGNTGPYERLFTALLAFVAQAPEAMRPDSRGDFAPRASWDTYWQSSMAATVVSEKSTGPAWRPLGPVLMATPCPRGPVFLAAYASSIFAER